MKNLVEKLINQSVEFSCKQISYLVTKDHIIVTGNSATFHPTSIIAMFENISDISQYLQYNKKTEEIELVIFWRETKKS
jgi:hypothetical protein